VIDPELLSEYPPPIQVMVATAALPLEVAFTSVKILKNTEALIGELVYLLSALRPAVAGVTQAYANGQFDQVFRTIDQIQHGTNAIALVWAPFTAVRDRLVPGLSPDVPVAQPMPRRQLPPPARPSAAPAHRQQSQLSPPAPSTGEWLGRIGGQVWDQANTIPGAGLLTGPLRRVGSALADVALTDAEPRPVDGDELPAPAGLVVDPVEETVEEPPRSSPSLLPGPVRRLFGGG
jgi:hypothetical protein